MFNQFLCALKDELRGTRYSHFWTSKVAGGGVTLISSNESSSCSITPEQAAQVTKAVIRARYRTVQYVVCMVTAMSEWDWFQNY